jgi:hypothetical protein
MPVREGLADGPIWSEFLHTGVDPHHLWPTVPLVGGKRALVSPFRRPNYPAWIARGDRPWR